MSTITEQKECWTVTVNRDRTEGRGPLYVAHVCWNESTARRLAKGKCVQGLNGKVSKAFAIKIDGDSRWYVPANIIKMNKDDGAMEKKLEAERLRQQEIEAALERAKAAGVSDDDIAILSDKRGIV